jgi:hypothetical protein
MESKGALGINVSFPLSSTVTAASFFNVNPIAKGCPELLGAQNKSERFDYCLIIQIALTHTSDLHEIECIV